MFLHQCFICPGIDWCGFGQGYCNNVNVLSYYNLRKDTGRQPRTLFQPANYFAVSRPILTKSGTDNLSGPERELAMSEFLNLKRLPWKFGNAGFEAPFCPEALIFWSQDPLKSESYWPANFFTISGFVRFCQFPWKQWKVGSWVQTHESWHGKKGRGQLSVVSYLVWHNMLDWLILRVFSKSRICLCFFYQV